MRLRSTKRSHHSRTMSPLSQCESNTTNSKEPRNQKFNSDQQPFEDDTSLSLLGATGTFKFFNPTSAQYSWSGWNPSHDHSFTQHSHAASHISSDEGSQKHSSEDEGEPEGHFPARRKDDVLSFVWRSRDNRKGRHALVLRRGEDGQEQPHGTLEPTNSLPATLRGICALFTRFPYWDISWCVAIVYTLGSLVWVANGFAGVMPLVGKGSSEELKSTSTWTAFAGASIFFLGSYLLFLEAVNANRSGCFGWAVERTIKGMRPEAEVHPGDCEHHYHAKDKHPHTNKPHEDENDSDNMLDFVGEDDDYETTASGSHHSAMRNSILTTEDEETNHLHSYKWLWWPSWHDLRTHFLYEIGFLACAIQLVSGSLFWLSKFTTFPGITEHISQPVLDGTNWAPQIIGCIGFIVASLLFMLETQQKWYMPAPNVLGWHVGFWKLVGCLGFLLSAVFGPLGQHGMQFAENQSTISIFWGSWTILLGSLVQWYESLDKHPIVEEGTSRYSEWNEKFIKESEERRGNRSEDAR